ncbi:Polysaccharide deacetylase [Paenibacillus sp. UNCCL117]|uniref:polysaccharide deacetylase family protein n=1 Tax=unclassified Paenibacillus TaxID=185978 RepID=UPI00088E633B|nr:MULTISPECIES: polysaccharide deacetylase family protein [unclassified Paenibacillus]SDD63331.1 Polysaccharide deacetylase [Paenibacillus sp. cl123]SFW67770.1 Polysaccharide deacetylase [Paenibacillus sp. UNCCL117]
MTRPLLFGLLAALMLIGTLQPWLPASSGTYRDQVAVLMYHHVADDAESSSTVSTDLFRRQLSYLKQQGYHFITMQELIRYYQGDSVPEKAVFVTFDDGYRSFYTGAYPILKELDVPAVNFAITKDLENPDLPSIPALKKEQIREMLAYRPGMFDIQCHTHELHYKAGHESALSGRLQTSAGTAESDQDYAARIRQDSESCARTIQDLYGDPVAPQTYAYPYGLHNAAVQSYIRESGFRYAFTIVSGMATRSSDSMAIPRINAGHPGIEPEFLDKSIQLRIERVTRPHKPEGV